MKKSFNFALISILVGLSALSIEILKSPSVQAGGCHWADISCNPHIKPITKPVAEQAWGEAGAAAYQSAAQWMRANNGSSQGFDETQKRYLRPHFGDLLDRVAVIYNANLLDEWSAGGYKIRVAGVESAAQTYCNRIYVDDPYKPNDIGQLKLLAHELTHSKQCEQLGGAGKFGFHYFREYKRAGQNYENNKLEREAYDFENQFASWLSSQPGSNPAPPRVGYFDNGVTVFYSNGTSYCGFVSPKHLEFTQKVNQAPSLGRQDPSMFGTDSGVCPLPSGYFDNGATVFFSAGDGTFCGFPNQQALDSHQRSRPQQPSFGRIDIDPNRFMSSAGVCQ